MEDSSSLSSSTSAVEDIGGGVHLSSEADDESGSDLATPPSKRKKQTSVAAIRGAATYKTVYNSDWEKQYPVGPANDTKYAFYCIPCKKNVSCSHMGKADVKQH